MVIITMIIKLITIIIILIIRAIIMTNIRILELK